MYPLHEAELRLALEIGHGNFVRKALSFASKRGERGHSSLQLREAQAGRIS
jgi:hypothetical protein